MAGRATSHRARAAVTGGVVAIIAIAAVGYQATRSWRPNIPRVWDEAALRGARGVARGDHPSRKRGGGTEASRRAGAAGA